MWHCHSGSNGESTTWKEFGRMGGAGSFAWAHRYARVLMRVADCLVGYKRRQLQAQTSMV